MTIGTITVTKDASWDIVANGGNFGGDTNSVQGTLTPTQQMAAADALFNQILTDLSSWIDAPSAILHIQKGWGTINGGGLNAGAIAQSQNSYFNTISYASLVSNFNAMPANAVNQSMAPFIPGTTPFGADDFGEDFNTTALQYNQNGFSKCFVGILANTGTWDYTPSYTTPGTGLFSGYCVWLHEITQAFGRALVYGQLGTLSAPILACFTAPGTFTQGSQLGGGSSGYFSIDGGTTNLGAMQTNSTGDQGDFDASVGSTFDSFFSTGILQTLGTREFRQMGSIWPLTPLGVTLAGFSSGSGGSALLSGVSQLSAAPNLIMQTSPKLPGQGNLIAGPVLMAPADQDHYRWRTDTNAVDGTPTWPVNQDTQWTN